MRIWRVRLIANRAGRYSTCRCPSDLVMCQLQLRCSTLGTCNTPNISLLDFLSSLYSNNISRPAESAKPSNNIEQYCQLSISLEADIICLCYLVTRAIFPSSVAVYTFALRTCSQYASIVLILLFNFLPRRRERLGRLHPLRHWRRGQLPQS